MALWAGHRSRNDIRVSASCREPCAADDGGDTPGYVGWLFSLNKVFQDRSTTIQQRLELPVAGLCLLFSLQHGLLCSRRLTLVLDLNFLDPRAFLLGISVFDDGAS